jgi:hypothetical protein
VGYRVGKAIAKILSRPAASSRGVDRIDGAGRPGGKGARPEIPARSRSTSVVVTLRFGTVDWEFGGGKSAVTTGDSSATIDSSTIEGNDEDISPLIGKVSSRSREMVIYR